MSQIHAVVVVNASNVLPKAKEIGYMLADLSKLTGKTIQELVNPDSLIAFHANQKMKLNSLDSGILD